MKLKLKIDLSGIKDKICKWIASIDPKKKKAALVILGVVVIGASGYYGYKAYVYYIGPQKALEALVKAIKNADAEALAGYVNFNYVSENFAQAMREAYGIKRDSSGKAINYAEETQLAFLKALSDFKAGDKKEEKKPAAPSFELPPPPPVLPPDFVSQLGILKVLSERDGVVLLMSAIHHEELNAVFNFIIQFDKTSSGWQVTRVVNAQALVNKYREAMHDFFDRQDAMVQKKNEQVARRMENAFQIQSCLTAAGLVSDGSRGMMTININAFNLSDKAISSVNMLLDITDQDGKLVRQVRLNSTEKVYPGDEFKNRWVMELDPADQEYAPLLKAGKLSCKPVLKAMTLGNEVVWITEIKSHEY